MRPADVWRNVSSKIGFHTKETADAIPSLPGIYAWFLPLWLYETDLGRFIDFVARVHLYDATTRAKPQADADVRLHWKRINVRLSPLFRSDLQEGLEEHWARVQAAPALREAFQTAMMEASLLLPPLYVGKADDLHSRYQQHVDGTDPSQNNFHTRFAEHAANANIPLRVADLLFVCIPFDAQSSELIRENQINRLVEQVVMRLAHPPFSVK